MLVMDPQPSDRVRYVFDEGDLLERIPREINRTLSDICEGYRLCYLQLQPSNVGEDGGGGGGGGGGGSGPSTLGVQPPYPHPFFPPNPHTLFSFIFLRWYPCPKFKFFAPAHFLSEDPQPPPQPPGPRTPCPPPRQQLLVMGTWLDLPQRWGACKMKQTPNLSLGKLHS